MGQKCCESRLLRISEDNDYLNFRGEGTDRAYSSGFNAEYYYTRNKPARSAGRLLIPLRDSAINIYSWGFTHEIYTPSDMWTSEIVHGQRPYAGLAYLTHSLISIDVRHKQSLISAVSLGVLGKYSFAKELQSTYHSLVDHPVANGWENQVSTDVIFNYLVKYEHMLVNPNSNLDIIGDIVVNTGTLHNDLSIGLHVRCGLFNGYFTGQRIPALGVDSKNARNFQIYFFTKMNGITVMDNATLQGGFFTHNSSPYTINKDSISRFGIAYEYGLVISGKNWGISGSEKIRTPEFIGSFSQQVGNITLFVGL